MDHPSNHHSRLPAAIRSAVGVLCLLCLTVAHAEEPPDIQVLGLFKNAAVLKINGNQQMLRTGQRSTGGVLLKSATSVSATIEFEGKTSTLSLSKEVNSSFAEPTETTVSIQLNSRGQYMTTGSINDRPVRFLVDTGASIVAFNSKLADELGLQYRNSRELIATTASGTVASYHVVLDLVQVGNIRLQRVDAAVLEGDYPIDVLLGMTFLRRVALEERAGVLLLTAKF